MTDRERVARALMDRASPGTAWEDVSGATRDHFLGLADAALAAVREWDAKQSQAEHMTTQQAADLLNVSRPHVIKLIETGKLPATMAGTHRRLLRADVESYRATQKIRKRAALSSLVADAQGMWAYDAKGDGEDGN